MEVIKKAMQETQFKPRAKWWGFVKDGKRYLMRYHHNFAIFSATDVLYSHHETKTDKAGVEYAIKYFNENPSLFADLTKERPIGKPFPLVLDKKATKEQLEATFGTLLASYSRKEAIKDGILIELDKDVAKGAGIKIPVAVTRPAWQMVEDAVYIGHQDIQGVIMDLLIPLVNKAATEISHLMTFEVLMWEKHVGKHRIIKFKAVCSAGDTPDPVLTIMLPKED